MALLYVYYLGDFERAGRDAVNTLVEKLARFSKNKHFTVHFKQIAITED